MESTLPPTLRFFGPFEILVELGRGGSATVYKACHRTTGSMVALKVSPRLLKLAPDNVERFIREFTVIRPLRHPNLVSVLDQGEHDGFPYLVMELVPGQNLADRLKETGCLSPQQAVALFLQIAEGMRYLHARQILHRDIKPSNIFVTPSNEAKLGDFGLLKNLANNLKLTGTRQSLGTLEYGAPEQFTDAKYVDHRCDLYSFAATFYTALTGIFPFGSAGHWQILQRKCLNQFVPLRMLVPTLDPAVDQLVSRCLDFDRAKRPDSFEEIYQVLRNNRSAPVQEMASIAGTEAWWLPGCDRRKCERWTVNLSATYIPFHQKQRGSCSAKIVDVSTEGLRLWTPHVVAANAVLQLALGQAGGTKLALVRWTKSAKNDIHLAGCCFVEPLSSEELNEFYLATVR